MAKLPAKTKIFTTRLARKTFFLFVLSALLPLTVLTTLSYQQIDKLIVSSHKAQLRSAAKSYGIALYDRLVMASEQITNMEKSLHYGDLGVSGDGGFNSRYFKTIILEIDGVVASKLGDPVVSPELIDKDIKHFQRNEYLLKIDKSSSIWIIKKTKISSMDGYIFAKISNFIWGAPDSWDQSQDFIVTLPDGRKLFRTNIFGDQGDGRLLSEGWTLHIKALFGSESLRVVARVNESALLATSKSLNYYVVLTSIFAMLLVCFISFNFIRRNTEALASLKRGIERINVRDFSTQVDIQTNDEFALIAHSFNSMASKMGGQLRAMESLAEIDRLILERIKKDEIIDIVLEQTGYSFESKKTLFLVKKDKTENTYVIFSPESQIYVDGGENTLEMTEKSILSMASNSEKSLDIRASLPDDLSGFFVGDGYLLCTPICLDKQVEAILFSVFEIVPDVEKLSIIKTFGDHIAVALANSEWEKRLFHQAHFDGLTGLPNRNLALDRLVQAISVASSSYRRVALFFLDLDEFKTTNDSLGHLAGDKLLKVIGSRFNEVINTTDTLARLGGDEFVLIHSVVSGTPEGIIDECECIANKLIQLSSQPVLIDENSIISSASVGIAFYPEDGRDAESLLKNADRAMYYAKDKGKHNYQFYDSKLNETARTNIKLVADIHQAIKNNEFELFYQPKVYTQSTTISGCEALIRWNHPSRGFLSPVSFIEAAEQHGIINDVGCWVITEAISQKAEWNKSGLLTGPVAINVSPKQLTRDDFVPFVEATLYAHDVSGSDIEFEITETAFIQDIQLLGEALERIYSLGIDVSIDDYGTGFASINLLANLSVQKLKIDGSYIASVCSSDRQASIVQSMISLAHSLDLSVVAEGVEDREQLRLLRSLGCEEIQGYFYSKPLAVDNYVKFLRDYNSRPNIRAIKGIK